MHTVEPVTAGDGPERYSLYAALFFADMHRLKGFTEPDGTPIPFALLGRTATLRINDEYAVLRVHDWTAHPEAQRAFRSLYDGMARLITHHRIALYNMCGPQGIDWAPNEWDVARDNWPPEVYAPWKPRQPQTDGGIWPHGWHILPEHKRIVRYPQLYGREVREVTPVLLQDACTIDARENRADPWTDDRLRLALQLISEANAQWSQRLELLNLVRALEVLRTHRSIGKPLIALIDNWKDELTRFAESAAEPDLTVASKRLCDRLSWLKDESIAESLRRLAEETCPCDANQPAFTQPEDVRKAVNEVYDVRSKLVHTGRVPAKKECDQQTRIYSAASVARYLAACAAGARLRAPTPFRP
jgi:hypothetical protein